MTERVDIFFCLGVYLNAYQKGNIVLSKTTAGETQIAVSKLITILLSPFKQLKSSEGELLFQTKSD